MLEFIADIHSLLTVGQRYSSDSIVVCCRLTSQLVIPHSLFVRLFHTRKSTMIAYILADISVASNNHFQLQNKFLFQRITCSKFTTLSQRTCWTSWTWCTMSHSGSGRMKTQLYWLQRPASSSGRCLQVSLAYILFLELSGSIYVYQVWGSRLDKVICWCSCRWTSVDLMQ